MRVLISQHCHYQMSWSSRVATMVCMRRLGVCGYLLIFSIGGSLLTWIISFSFCSDVWPGCEGWVKLSSQNHAVGETGIATCPMTFLIPFKVRNLSLSPKWMFLLCIFVCVWGVRKFGSQRMQAAVFLLAFCWPHLHGICLKSLAKS